MSESMYEEPQLVRQGKPSRNADFRRNAPNHDDLFGDSPEFIASRSNSAFKRYMNQPESGGDESRLQALREKHGWGLLRSRYSQGGREYANAWKAEQLRFRGIGRWIQNKAEDQPGAEDLTDTQMDAGIVNSYNTIKSNLKQAAGWGRFIPFSAKRAAYKRARQELRTGNFTGAGMGKFSSKMPQAMARAQTDAYLDAQDADMMEIRGLLGQGGDSGRAVPSNGGQAMDPNHSRQLSAEIERPDDDEIDEDERPQSRKVMHINNLPAHVSDRSEEPRISKDSDMESDSDDEDDVKMGGGGKAGASQFRDFLMLQKYMKGL